MASKKPPKKKKKKKKSPNERYSTDARTYGRTVLVPVACLLLTKYNSEFKTQRGRQREVVFCFWTTLSVRNYQKIYLSTCLPPRPSPLPHHTQTALAFHLYAYGV